MTDTWHLREEKGRVKGLGRVKGARVEKKTPDPLSAPCCEDAPPDMRGEAHFDRSRFGTHEEFTIGVIPPSAYPRVMEAIQKDPPSVKTVDGDYVYYESKAESKSDHYVIFTRVVGYKDRLFGMGYHAKNLNVHVGDTLETSSLPPEIEEAIRSFRVIEEAEVATDAGDG